MAEHLVTGREPGVAQRRLLGAVGRRVAAHHVRRRVTEQVLHVEFAGVVLDRPGREGVAEAVGVHLRDPASACEPSQHGLSAEQPR